MNKGLIALTVAVFLSPQVAHAEITHQSNYTTDTATGLDWFDLSLDWIDLIGLGGSVSGFSSWGMSYNEVIRISSIPGSFLEGWNFASSQQVHTLFLDAANSLCISPQCDINNPVDSTLQLMKSLGITNDGYHSGGATFYYDRFVNGLTSDSINPGYHSIYTIAVTDATAGNAGIAFDTPNSSHLITSQYDNTSASYAGSFLVRSSQTVMVN